ncbi:MAG: hypothetical protein HYX88_03400 [Chloroflexi bacterium]|nr:hypothetical protein [Chloroflexota bacterium]
MDTDRMATAVRRLFSDQAFYSQAVQEGHMPEDLDPEEREAFAGLCQRIREGGLTAGPGPGPLDWWV